MLVCGSCGAECTADARFCSQCAAPLQAARPVAQERKVVTSLFCDLVAFTALSEAADPEDVDALLGRYFAAARSSIEAFGGTVEKFIGDAVVGVFGVPAAHEDDPERAVRAGLRIVQAVEDLTRPDGSPLQLRVGVNTGEALVRLDVTPGSGEGFLTGDAVNTAARIQSVAPVMGVAAGRSTFEATKQVFDYVELEPSTVKGKSEPVAVWQAVAPLARFGTDITRRHDAPLVGREIDLAVLKGLFDQTVAASSPQLVTIVGEPGLGKSRLVAELFGYIDSLPRLITWRQGRCLPYGEGVTFWAVAEIVKAHAGIYDTDPVGVALAKLDAVLPEVEERAWLRQRLLALLGMEASSTAEQGELFTAWRRFLESLAGTGPAVVVFEDLHWADPALLAFLEHLADRAEGVPLLILATARTELYEQHPDYGRGLRDGTSINLSPLTDAETTRLVKVLLDTVAVPDDLQDLLVERAGGNPLFAEEYVRLLQDQDLIERVDVQVRLRPAAEMPLPDNVQALIAARLDALAPDRKALLADAAVVGKVFWAGAVASMAQRDESEVLHAMRDLAHKELIRPVRQSSMAGQTEYTFWHVLARDVAYQQLPRRLRATQHLAAAQWIGVQGRAGEEQAEVLAHHYTTALELAIAAGDDTLVERARPAAVTYLALAGERALGLDTSAAVKQLGRAVEVMSEQEPGRAQILTTYGVALLHAGRPSDAKLVLEQALALFRGDGDLRAAATTLNHLGLVYERLNDERWVDVPREAWNLLRQVPAGVEHVRALTELAAVAMLVNRHLDAIQHADDAVELAAQLGMDPPPRALGFRAGARCSLGDDRGLADFHLALASAAAAGQGREVGVMHLNLAGATDILRGPAAGLEACHEGIAYSRARGLSDNADMIAAGSLDCMLDLGKLREVARTAAELARSLQAAGNVRTLLWARGPEVRALALMGSLDATTDLLDWLESAAPPATDNPEAYAIALGAAALGHAALGHEGRAIEIWARISGHSQVSGSFAAARQLTAWVRALVSLGQSALAERITTDVQPTCRQPLLARDAARAALLEARGHTVEALDGYTVAARELRDFTAVTDEAFALFGQGRCLLALDRAEEAVPVLERARCMFTEMGAHPALAEVETLLARGEQFGFRHPP